MFQKKSKTSLVEPSREHRVIGENLLSLSFVESTLFIHADDASEELWPKRITWIHSHEQRRSEMFRCQSNWTYTNI